MKRDCTLIVRTRGRCLHPSNGACLNPFLTVPFVLVHVSAQIYVIDSADRRRMEETGVELQQLLDEVRSNTAICNLIPLPVCLALTMLN